MSLGSGAFAGDGSTRGTSPPGSSPYGDNYDAFKTYYGIPSDWRWNSHEQRWEGATYYDGSTNLRGPSQNVGGSFKGSQQNPLYSFSFPVYSRSWVAPGTTPGTNPPPGTGTGTGTTTPPPTVYTPPIQQQPIAVASPGTAAVPNALIAYAAPTDIPAGWKTSTPAQGGLGQASNFAQVKW